MCQQCINGIRNEVLYNAGQDDDAQQRLKEQAAALLHSSAAQEEATAAAQHVATVNAVPVEHRAIDAEGDVDTEDAEGHWAEDVASEEYVPFQDDGTQDFDHQLGADEQHWESTSLARRLPPGWAKCPNAGAPVFGLTPIKVR
jgi:hypothetical protein